MAIKDYNRPPMNSPDPEPVIKVPINRNDAALEKLLDDYLKGLDKNEEEG